LWISNFSYILADVEITGATLRAARKRHRLTQNEVAARSGIRQGNISALENADGGFNTVTVEKVLTALGEQTALLPTVAPTAEAAAAGIAAALRRGSRDAALRNLLVFHDGLARAEAALKCALAVAEPATTGHNGWDAFLAGIVDFHIPKSHRPRWTAGRDADNWFIDGSLPVAVLDEIRSRTPAAIAAHGVWVHDTDLTSV
jgi:transcriptional regulator with XRE-family HTH domain